MDLFGLLNWPAAAGRMVLLAALLALGLLVTSCSDECPCATADGAAAGDTGPADGAPADQRQADQQPADGTAVPDGMLPDLLLDTVAAPDGATPDATGGDGGAAATLDPTSASFAQQVGCRPPKASLKVVSERTFSKSNVTVTNTLFTNGVRVTGSNVTFRDCWFESAANNVVERAGGKIRLEYCTIRGKSFKGSLDTEWPSNCIGYSSWEMWRCDLGDCADGGKIQGNCSAVENWIHDLQRFKIASGYTHNDGLQSTQGSGMSILRNRIEGRYQQSTSAIKITSEKSNVDDVVIDGNYLFGGSFTLYVTQKPGYACPTKVHVTGNTFAKGSSINGWRSYCNDPSQVWSNNRWDDGTVIAGQ